MELRQSSKTRLKLLSSRANTDAEGPEMSPVPAFVARNPLAKGGFQRLGLASFIFKTYVGGVQTAS